MEKCSRGRFQPLLLLYANPSASPVSVDTAPRKRVMAPGYSAGRHQEILLLFSAVTVTFSPFPSEKKSGLKARYNFHTSTP